MQLIPYIDKTVLTGAFYGVAAYVLAFACLGAVIAIWAYIYELCQMVDAVPMGQRRFLPLDFGARLFPRAIRRTTTWKKWGCLTRLEHAFGRLMVGWFASLFLRLPYIAVSLLAMCEMASRAVVGFALNIALLISYSALSLLSFTASALVRLADALFVNRGVRHSCPECKQQFPLPIYVCPKCWVWHENLRPGKYGILHKRCACGHRIPCAAITGRNKMDAACPYCKATLASGGAPQISLQLVGGTNAGKTAYLAAFWHLYLERAANDGGRTAVKTTPKELFKPLARSYIDGETVATSSRNALTYTAIHSEKGRDVFQLSIYDIAGEVFTDGDYQNVPEQFAYCDGFLVVIDPLCVAGVRLENEISDDSPIYSRDDIDAVIDGFVNKFAEVKGLRSNARSTVPVSVIITKTDIKELKRRIGPPKVKVTADSQYDGDVRLACDSMCRDYLGEIGLQNVVNNLDSLFASVHFFPLSAIGHDAGNGEPYAPWGVLEPVDSILSQNQRRIPV